MIKTTVEEQWRGKEVKIRGKKVTGRSAFEIGLIVEGQAKLLAPVRFGYLAASITTQSQTDGTRPTVPQRAANTIGTDPGPPSVLEIAAPLSSNVVLVGTPVEYAPWQEFGTKYMDAQPFLRPALALAQGKALSIVAKNGKFFFADYLK